MDLTSRYSGSKNHHVIHASDNAPGKHVVESSGGFCGDAGTNFLLLPLSRDSVVGIATVYGLDDRGVEVRVPVESRIFSSLRRPDRL
jgi:hypothetical protein